MQIVLALIQDGCEILLAHLLAIFASSRQVDLALLLAAHAAPNHGTQSLVVELQGQIVPYMACGQLTSSPRVEEAIHSSTPIEHPYTNVYVASSVPEHDAMTV